MFMKLICSARLGSFCKVASIKGICLAQLAYFFGGKVNIILIYTSNKHKKVISLFVLQTLKDISV